MFGGVEFAEAPFAGVSGPLVPQIPAWVVGDDVAASFVAGSSRRAAAVSARDGAGSGTAGGSRPGSAASGRAVAAGGVSIEDVEGWN